MAGKSKIVFLCCCALCVSAAIADSTYVGETYPIVEPDALLEIQTKTETVNWTKEINNMSTESAFDSIRIPYAAENTTRTYQNIYVVPDNIVDQNGKIIYPKGYKYNVHDYVDMKGRVVVIRKDHVQWYLNNQPQMNDIVILADSGLKDVARELKRRVFLLDEDTLSALNIEAAPTVIEQEENYLRINEYEAKRDADYAQ